MGLKSHNIDTVLNNRPRLIEYSQLSIDVKEFVDYTIQENLKPNPELRLKSVLTKIVKPKQLNLWSLSWSDIIELRIAVSEQKMFEVLNIVFGINETEFARLDLFNAFSVYKWIVEQFKSIVEIESQELSSEMSDEEKEAGVEELQEFGYSVMLDGIAKGDLLKYDEYLKLPYVKIFRKMCLDKKRYDINKQMQENASTKSKRNS